MKNMPFLKALKDSLCVTPATKFLSGP